MQMMIKNGFLSFAAVTPPTEGMFTYTVVMYIFQFFAENHSTFSDIHPYNSDDIQHIKT